MIRSKVLSIKRTLASTGASYLALVSSVASTLLLIRLATHYLSPEELGLWTFCFSAVGYFLLLDFGVSNSLGRLFADSISKGDDRATSGWLLLALSVLAIQGIAVVIAGFLLRDPIIDWFDIPGHLVPEAKALWTWLVFLQALTLPGRALPGIIHAQNRVYSIHLFSIISAWTSVLLFWLWIRHGAGVMSYAYSSAAAMTVTQAGYIISVFMGRERLNFHWVLIPWQHLRELFGYAGAIFVLGLATQAMVASQGLIVTKLIGLEALAVFNMTGRLPSMVASVILHPFNAACPRWVLQYTTGQSAKCRREYELMLRVTVLSAVAVCAFIILVNGPFVRWWTKPEFFGGNLLTALLCLAVLPAAINHCLGFPFHLTKRLSLYTSVLLAGVALEVGLSIFLVRSIGLPGIPMAVLLVAFGLTLWFHLIVGGKLISVRAGKVLSHEWPTLTLTMILVILGSAVILPLWNGDPFTTLIVSGLIGAACVFPAVARLLLVIQQARTLHK